jgi:hypothetical protein
VGGKDEETAEEKEDAVPGVSTGGFP